MKRINIINKLETLVDKNVQDWYRDDFKLDQKKLRQKGKGIYYFMTRSCGTVLISDTDMKFNPRAQQTWDYYTDTDRSAQGYKVVVEKVAGNKVFGTVHALRNERVLQAA